MTVQPRGIRNNNPGNIRWGDNWKGLVPENKRTDRSFCQFIDVKYGIRAIARILLNYRNREGMKRVGNKGIDTVREIISRWAPPNENNTEAYIQSVAKACGVGAEQPISVTDDKIMLAIVKAIIKHENGVQPYSDEVLLAGIHMA
ncbi:putative virion protein [Escherichia phage vB_EcoS_HdK1]|nr:putative virion protein [Escherichia phage vB_EcoS_HdK1]